MSVRTLFFLVTVAIALTFTSPVDAAPLAQTVVDEVFVTSSATFTLTVRIDEVTTLAIPMQVDWRAQGPNEANSDEVSVAVSPTVLRTGIFSVTVGSVEPLTGTLAVTLTQAITESAPLTTSDTTTGTTTTTGTVSVTVPATATTTVSVPITTGPTANAISNLRAGPGTDYPIVGSAAAGDPLDVAGQNSDGTWLVLANGTWIATFLVNNVPEDLPVVAPTATPSPSPATSNTLTATVTPTP